MIAARYRLDEVVVRDGARRQWRAVDATTGHSVILEELRTEGSPERAVSAARAAGGVQHPHLVALLDVVEEGGVVWSVRADDRAPTLAELVARYGPMSVSAAAQIGAQTAAGIAAAHAAGVAHGALSPDVLLVADTGAGPFARVAGLGAPSPTAEPAADVHALGTVLSAAVGGADRAGPLTPLIRWFTAADPDARPSALQAHAELARSVALLTVPPDAAASRARWHVLAAAAGVLVLLAAGLVVALRGTTDVPAGPPDAPAPVVIADERRADPCSLIDAAALSPFGHAAIRPGYGPFAQCTAVIPVTADDEAHVDVEIFNDAVMVGDVDLDRRDPSGPVVVPGEQYDGYCNRYVLLPQTHLVSVSAVRYGFGANDPTDYCAMADTATRAVVDRLVGGPIAARSSDEDRSGLDGIAACGLLDEESVTAAAGVAGAVADGGPALGTAGWSCEWGPVWIDYMREAAPGAPEHYGEPVMIGGRQGMTRWDDRTSCRAYVPQRFFVAADGGLRAEYVRVIVDGTAEIDTICSAAVGLAERIATKLPPFG